MVDIVDIALCICKLLLYNNFKRGGNVTSQFLCNVSDVILVPYFGRIRILIASLSNVKCSVMLWSDNRNIMDYWIFAAGYCFKYVF